MQELRAELFGDGQIPVFSVRAGRVHDVNSAARAMFAEARAGTEVGELFDERSREKLTEALHEGASGATPELQVRS